MDLTHEEITIFIFGLISGIFIFSLLLGLANRSTIKEYRVLHEFTNHGYQLRYDGIRLYHHVTDEVLYQKFLKKQQRKVLNDLKRKMLKRRSK